EGGEVMPVKGGGRSPRAGGGRQRPRLEVRFRIERRVQPVDGAMERLSLHAGLRARKPAVLSSGEERQLSRPSQVIEQRVDPRAQRQPLADVQGQIFARPEAGHIRLKGARGPKTAV